MRIALCNWRDLAHPEGGGAELYARLVAEGLVGSGHEVTFLCAAHENAPRKETINGVRYFRAGSRTSVYAAARRQIRRLEAREGRFDVVIDVQNGLPFFAGWATRTPVVVLVHHVHREQWPVVFGPTVAALGWGIESRVAPRLNRGRQYVAVSHSTRDELAQLGVDPQHVAIIHNGTQPAPALSASQRLRSTVPDLRSGDSGPDGPRLLVLGRVVKHKRIEHAVDVTVALREKHPGLRLRVVGDGWWRDELRDYVHARGAQEYVDLLGFVDEETKHRELAAADLLLVPSVKEGWGLSVVEAASHGVPAIGYREAGGVSESIEDGTTGLLVDDLDQMRAGVDALLSDPERLDQLGANALAHSARFTWDETVRAWENILLRAAWGHAPTALTDHAHAVESATLSTAPVTRRSS